jgi:hypothetical protein
MIINNNIIGKSLSDKIHKIFFLKQKLLKGDNQINSIIIKLILNESILKFFIISYCKLLKSNYYFE